MEEPGFNDPRLCRVRDLQDSAHEMEHAFRRMERDMKHAERERMHAIRDAFKNMYYPGAGGQGAASPRTVDEVLVELDSYISDLEDLPKEKLAPYENKVDSISKHLEKVRCAMKDKE